MSGMLLQNRHKFAAQFGLKTNFFLFQNPNATISRPTQDFRNNQKLLFALFIALSNLLDLFPCPECPATILQQVTVDNHNTFFYDTSLKP